MTVRGSGDMTVGGSGVMMVRSLADITVRGSGVTMVQGSGVMMARGSAFMMAGGSGVMGAGVGVWVLRDTARVGVVKAELGKLKPSMVSNVTGGLEPLYAGLGRGRAAFSTAARGSSATRYASAASKAGSMSSSVMIRVGEVE